MDLADPVLRRVYFEIMENIPRQGPGSTASTRRALSFCQVVKPNPQILDLGAGSGAQSMVLVEAFPKGHVTAIEKHNPYIARMKSEIAMKGVYEHLLPLCANMDRFPFMPGHCDIVWCENAVHFLGLKKALEQWRKYAKPGGYIGFSTPVWLTNSPAEELKKYFEAEIPDMGTAEDIDYALKAANLKLEGRFMLPEEDWWTDYYLPIKGLCALVRQVRDGQNPEACAALDKILEPIELRTRFADQYGLAFTVARKPL